MPIYYESVSEAAGLKTFGGYGELILELLLDEVAAGDGASYEWVLAVAEALGLSTTATNVLVAQTAVTDAFRADDALFVVLEAVIQEALAVSDSPAQALVVLRTVRDALVAAGVAESNAVANLLVAAAVAVSDTVSRAFEALLAEVAHLGDSAEYVFGTVLEVLEAVSMAEAVSELPIITLAVAEGVDIDAALTNHLLADVLLQDGVLAFVSLPLNDQIYTGWVLNTTNTAVSRYPNFNANSVCYDGSRYLAASHDGVYALEGNDDAGQDIDAWIRSGVDDFGTSAKKTFPYAYIAGRSDGSLVLKLVNDEKSEHWYELTLGESLETGRTRLGRGLKMRYLQFELRNARGADFELDELEFVPVMLSRRV